MKLFLAVPSQAKQSSSDRVVRLGQTREWIAKLPLLNSRESLQQIHSSLYRTNRTLLKAGQRLKLLDLYRSPLRIIRGHVETQLAKGAAPLSDDGLAIAELFRDCCLEMGYGYKSIILEIAQSGKRRQLDELRLSMGRALFYLEQTVYACAMYRQVPPEGIWQEIHTIYQYARKLGVANDAIRDPIAKTQTTTSITVVYEKVVLFGLADLFQQFVPLMGRMLEFLRKRAQDAQLSDYRPPPTERCQFVIDPHSDYPARAYVKQAEEKPPTDALLLDTVNLTRHAHEQLNTLRSAEELDIELDDEFKDDLGKKLLEEVVRAWGLIPRRQEERAEVADTRIETVTGLTVVTFCMNQEEPFELSSVDQADYSSVIRSHRMYLNRQRDTKLQRLDCHALDKGESGVKLSLPYGTPAVGSLRVADVVATRENGGSWIPGLIRWVRCAEDIIQFGVEHLQRPTRPVAVKAVSTDRESPFKEGLALYDEGTEASTLQLITPPGQFQNLRNLLVDDGEKLLMASCRKLIERSQTMEWFECERLNL